ncbi:hypothetical protein EI546_03910 [Aequorivita sp. H23M31]|uniref:Uncharacterized protein n=1 Tax=Aequorivita ciconiae TaxID=2494375 RepID=A0A410G103_9FLAO|nr:hypothetical protein [Aequorivita sp. H23M31]QAA80925.1 hypothetical protein EI546_03910 [Aequorivita sp. H23M31]
MKSFKIAILCFCTIFFISCKDKSTDSKVDLETEPTTELTAPDNSHAVDIDDENDTPGIMRTQDMTDMYQELNMTEDQIKRFEEDYKQKLNRRSSDNIEDHNLVDLQMDESLKDVLTPEQYAKFQEWRKSNPGER